MSDLSLGELLLSLCAAVVVLWIATKRGFFSFPHAEREGERPTFPLLVAAFAIYFLGGILVPALFLKAGALEGFTIAKISWTSFTTSALILAGLVAFSRAIPRPIWQGIWGEGSVGKEFGFALIGWLVSFPVVVCVGQLLTGVVYLLFHAVELPDQIAIRLMKLSFGQPLLFLLNGISVILFAPMIEELLFRGFLQSYLRRFLPKFFAIACASLLFALLHYSKEQGLGNIPLLGSLFTFSWFLGFVYERQRSLLASIALHATFNTLSVMSLYFLGKS